MSRDDLKKSKKCNTNLENGQKWQNMQHKFQIVYKKAVQFFDQIVICKRVKLNFRKF